jgi:hypothetical protein
MLPSLLLPLLWSIVMRLILGRVLAVVTVVVAAVRDVILSVMGRSVVLSPRNFHKPFILVNDPLELLLAANGATEEHHRP